MGRHGPRARKTVRIAEPQRSDRRGASYGGGVMLSAQDLDRFAREYYLSDDIADHGIENTLQRASAPRILNQLAPGERVLEMGYGDGLLTEELVRRGLALELVEGSKLLCEEAKR